MPAITDSPRLLLVTLLVLASGTALALLRIIDGAQWVQLATWALGLHAGGAVGVTVAAPAAEALRAKAAALLRGAGGAAVKVGDA